MSLKPAKPRQPQYAFLPRREKEVINHVTATHMYRVLEEGDYTTFCRIVGIIADQKFITGQISEDHEKVLKIVDTLFRKAIQ